MGEAGRSREAFVANAELFRAHMLTEMAKMSCTDGLPMKLHRGSWRNHNQRLFEQYGRDRGADIPTQTGYVAQLNRCWTAWRSARLRAAILGADQ